MTSCSEAPLLAVERLTTAFRVSGRLVPAVQELSFTIERGETFGLVGESGSGKSVTALSVLRLLPSAGRILQGRATLAGENLFDLTERAMQSVRGRRIGFVFQDPMTSLNPVMTIGQQVAEALPARSLNTSRGATVERATEWLARVELPNPAKQYRQYPHELSGGMRQRAMIAVALAGEPDLLVADEPTTALDVTIQAQILELLKSLQRDRRMALWLISHDLGIVAEMADRVAVMRNGRLVESGAIDDVFRQPKHPYTQQLFSALPSLSPHATPVRNTAKLLEVEALQVHYRGRSQWPFIRQSPVIAVDGVDLQIAPGSTLGLVGESGCGKSTLGKGLLGLAPVVGGRLLWRGQPLETLSAFERYRAIQVVFQDPYASMNPRMRVADIVEEGLRRLRPELSGPERRRKVVDLLERVGVDPLAIERYPHEFSGGQRQRICIARALAVEPALVVCDEITSALDVSVQRQIVELLKHLRDSDGLAYLFISHDLAVVAELADHIAVMHQGKIVEVGTPRDILLNPQHPYTRKLIGAIPKYTWERRIDAR